MKQRCSGNTNVEFCGHRNGRNIHNRFLRPYCIVLCSETGVYCLLPGCRPKKKTTFQVALPEVYEIFLDNKIKQLLHPIYNNAHHRRYYYA